MELIGISVSICLITEKRKGLITKLFIFWICLKKYFEKFCKTKTKNSIHKIFMHVKVLIPVVLLTVSLTGWETVAVVADTFVAKFCCETALRRWHNSVNEFSNVLFSCFVTSYFSDNNNTWNGISSCYHDINGHFYQT